jgi:hypothetical protein
MERISRISLAISKGRNPFERNFPLFFPLSFQKVFFLSKGILKAKKDYGKEKDFPKRPKRIKGFVKELWKKDP